MSSSVKHDEKSSSSLHSPNLYSLLSTPNEKESFLDNFNRLELNSDEDFGENFQESDENYFIMDAKLKKDREKRLNEKDKMYKIKKHYFLKKSYSETAEKEMEFSKLEIIKEKVYLDFCHLAEEKLRQGKDLDMTDCNYLFRRNFPLLDNKEKKAISKLQNLHFAFQLAAAASSIVMISYIRSIMVYFKFEILGKKFLSHFLLGTYGLGIYFSIMHFVEISQLKKLKFFYLSAKDRILNEENEIFKTPYDESEKTYNAEEKLNAENIFKF